MICSSVHSDFRTQSFRSECCAVRSVNYALCSFMGGKPRPECQHKPDSHRGDPGIILDAIRELSFFAIHNEEGVMCNGNSGWSLFLAVMAAFVVTGCADAPTAIRPEL